MPFHPGRPSTKPSPQPAPGHTGRGGRAAVLIVGVLAAAAAATSSSARAAAPTPAAINQSIAKGVAFLYSVQQPNGTWETAAPPPPGPVKTPPAADDRYATSDNNQYGGMTALAVYALLEAGEKPTEPKLKAAIAFLKSTASVSTYTLSLKCQVWTNLPPTNDVKQALRRDAAALLAGKKMTSGRENKNLVWDYATFATPRYNYSLNNVQNAAWGLSAAGAMDYEVPADVWKQIEKTFESAQLPDGGWTALIPNPKKPLVPTVYGTATGVSALYLAQDFTRADAYAIPRGNVISPSIEKGIGWISAKMTENEDKTSYESVHRRWYGIGTVALASGRRRLGTHDWYAEGAADLLERQYKRDGRWGLQNEKVDYRVTDTAWALLFLSRGRVPVAFNKLDYSPASPDAKKALWNQRPRDAANAAAWVGRATERELRWQIVDTNDTVDALLESPALYVAGGESLNLSADAKAKLKSYVEQGGLIFASADAANAAFARSVEKLAAELFPGSEWRDVPDAHPIFATQAYKRSAFKAKPQLRAIGNGVREFVLLAAVGDPAKTWQQRSGRINSDAWQLAANVLSYATDKSHFFTRGESWLVPADASVPRRTTRVVRLKYNGQWDPEPQAFVQFERYAKSRDLGIKTSVVNAGDAIADADVLYVTGSAAFTLDDKAREAIKTYLDGGGRVVFEAAGGSPAFANSAQAELTRWYGADSLKVLPATHAIYGDKLAVSYRGYNLATIDKPNEPQLRGIEKDGQLVAILSREDLTAGLLGVPTDGITGYTPDAARAVLLRVLSKWK